MRPINDLGGEPTEHRVVIVGGGFGGLPATRLLARKPVDVTLVDRRNHHLFQPLLYQVATGMLSPGQIAPPIRHVVRRHKNVRVVLAEVTGFKTHRTGGTQSPTLAGAPARLEELRDRTLPGLFGGEQPDCTNRNPARWTFLGQSWGDNTKAVEDYFARRVHPRWQPTTDGRVQYRVASMFAHPSVTAAFALADTQGPDVAVFKWDWSHTRSRVVSALACFQIATIDLFEYLGWRSPELVAWNDHLGRFVSESASAAPTQTGS